MTTYTTNSVPAAKLRDRIIMSSPLLTQEEIVDWESWIDSASDVVEDGVCEDFDGRLQWRKLNNQREVREFLLQKLEEAGGEFLISSAFPEPKTPKERGIELSLTEADCYEMVLLLK